MGPPVGQSQLSKKADHLMISKICTGSSSINILFNFNQIEKTPNEWSRQMAEKRQAADKICKFV
jgi:hypothetical protein